MRFFLWVPPRLCLGSRWKFLVCRDKRLLSVVVFLFPVRPTYHGISQCMGEISISLAAMKRLSSLVVLLGCPTILWQGRGFSGPLSKRAPPLAAYCYLGSQSIPLKVVRLHLRLGNTTIWSRRRRDLTGLFSVARLRVRPPSVVWRVQKTSCYCCSLGSQSSWPFSNHLSEFFDFPGITSKVYSCISGKEQGELCLYQFVKWPHHFNFFWEYCII